MPAEAVTPIMLKAQTAFRKGDAKTGAVLIRQAARSGNSIAEVLLGRLYVEGRGVPKDYGHALKILAAVVRRQKEPSLSWATEALHDLAERLKQSPNEEDRQLAKLVAALPALANPMVQQMGRNLQYNMAHSHYEANPFTGGLGFCFAGWCE